MKQSYLTEGTLDYMVWFGEEDEDIPFELPKS